MEHELTPTPLTDNQQRWLNHIQAAEQAGQSLKDYAAEHGLTLSAIYSYKAALRKRGHLASSKKTFTRVRLAPANQSSLLRIRLVNGISVETVDGTRCDVMVKLCQGLNRLP